MIDLRELIRLSQTIIITFWDGDGKSISTLNIYNIVHK